MKYKYYNKNGILLAESNSPIEFNTKLFPIFKDIEPKIEETKQTSFYKKSKED